MNTGLIIFLVLAFFAVVAALGTLFSRNAIYAALFLVANFSTIAAIYLTLGAPFIALVQITVYAGAIMVLFLFVIMLLGADKLVAGDTLPWQRPLAVLLGLVMLGEILYVSQVRAGLAAPLVIPTQTFGAPEEIGMTLFNNYLLPFEVTSVLLLVAAVGAIVLTRVEAVRRHGVRAVVRPTQDTAQPEESAQRKEEVGP